jgi:transposase
LRSSISTAAVRSTSNGVRSRAEAALKELSPVFDQMYGAVGRPSIPPQRLLKASLLMALYTMRSDLLFCEQLDYNLCVANC